ncbi:MAG: hypothetical protein ACSLFQ_14395, partial [Thermoanaerobaculia bacterium]
KAKPAPKAVKTAPKKPAKPAKPDPKKVAKPAKPAPKKVAKQVKVAPKKPAKATRPVAKAALKRVAAPAGKSSASAKKVAVAAKPVAKKALAKKPSAPPARAGKPAPATKAADGRKGAPAPAAKPVVVAKPAAKPAAPKAAKARRTRRGPRVTPTSAPLATWISQEGSRPSSFIPAPPRAKSAFTVAAAPASSDRLMREEDLAPPKPIKTVPVLVHVEQHSGRIEINCYPPVVELTPGAAVEWDFRYFGGVDVLVDHIVIEIQKPSPFSKATYKSPKPGSARPHRQMTDLVSAKSAGLTLKYTIHAVNAYRTELASGSGIMEVQG